MRVVARSHFEKLRRAVGASVVVLLAAAPALTSAAPDFKPTMADYLGVYDALQNYRFGVEKHDEKAAAKAFWPDGVNIAVPTPGGPEIRMSPDGRPLQPPAGQAGPGSGGPPPGFVPPPGANPPGPALGPPGGGAPGGAGGMVVWHLPLDSYIHFESATRATHYEYFLSIYPQPEKKAEAGERISNSEARASVVGWPGHYEDTLEKRHGEWRILQRKSMINQK